MHSSAALFISSDPTNHGADIGAVTLFALGIFALIGLLAFLITRRGRRPRRPASARARPMPGSSRRPQGREREQPREESTATDLKTG